MGPPALHKNLRFCVGCQLGSCTNKLPDLEHHFLQNELVLALSHCAGCEAANKEENQSVPIGDDKHLHTMMNHKPCTVYYN